MRAAAALALAAMLLVTLAAASDAVTICHHPGPLEDPFGENAKTMIVPRSALAAHLRHGDTIGPCDGGATPRPTIRPSPKPTPTPRPTATRSPTPTASPIATPSLPRMTNPPTDSEG